MISFVIQYFEHILSFLNKKHDYIMMSKINHLKYDLAFIAGAAIVLILLIYFFSAEQIRTMAFMLVFSGYVIGRYVGEKVIANYE